MSTSVSRFLTTLSVHFGHPKFDVPDDGQKAAYAEWLKAMSRALCRYPDDVLELAAETMTETRKFRNYPLLAECIEACDDARKKLFAARPKLFDQRRVETSFHAKERIALDLLRVGDVGKQAAREDWIGALFRFCRDEGRLPREKFEIDALKRESREFDAAFRDAVEIGNLSLISLGESMIEKRKRLASHVIDGVEYSWGR